ncbi:hypothetical protein I3I95_06940 [bacterium]|nr:hypothetical protein [bacterium]
MARVQWGAARVGDAGEDGRGEGLSCTRRGFVRGSATMALAGAALGMAGSLAVLGGCAREGDLAMPKDGATASARTFDVESGLVVRVTGETIGPDAIDLALTLDNAHGTKTYATLTLTMTVLARDRRQLSSTDVDVLTADDAPLAAGTSAEATVRLPWTSAAAVYTCDGYTASYAEARTVDRGDYGHEVVQLGTYQQTADGDPTPIAWWVVRTFDDGTRLLLAKRALERVPFNDAFVETTWDTCTLRGWLNGTFLDEAFSSDELAAIVEARTPADGETFPADAGEDGAVGSGRADGSAGADRPADATRDRVFVLSVADVVACLGARGDGLMHPELVARATDHAAAQGVTVNSDTGGTGWWLRTPGVSGTRVACVSGEGIVGPNGYGVNLGSFAVRPAILVRG